MSATIYRVHVFELGDPVETPLSAELFHRDVVRKPEHDAELRRLRAEYESTLRSCLALIDAMVPGTGFTPQDHESLNLVPLEIRALLGEEQP